MKFFKLYDGTQQAYQIDYNSFPKLFNYLSPNYEYLLKSKYVKMPKYDPHIKRLNTPEIAGYAPKIRNY